MVAQIAETDLARIRRFCEARTPAHLREEIRVEFKRRGRSVTIMERRAPWSDVIGPAWTQNPVAQLRYDDVQRLWTLHWADRNSRWHVYEILEPSPSVQTLLDEVDADPACIFWG